MRNRYLVQQMVVWLILTVSASSAAAAARTGNSPGLPHPLGYRPASPTSELIAAIGEAVSQAKSLPIVHSVDYYKNTGTNPDPNDIARLKQVAIDVRGVVAMALKGQLDSPEIVAIAGQLLNLRQGMQAGYAKGAGNFVLGNAVDVTIAGMLSSVVGDPNVSGNMMPLLESVGCMEMSETEMRAFLAQEFGYESPEGTSRGRMLTGMVSKQYLSEVKKFRRETKLEGELPVRAIGLIDGFSLSTDKDNGVGRVNALKAASSFVISRDLLLRVRSGLVGRDIDRNALSRREAQNMKMDDIARHSSRFERELHPNANSRREFLSAVAMDQYEGARAILSPAEWQLCELAGIHYNPSEDVEGTAPGHRGQNAIRAVRENIRREHERLQADPNEHWRQILNNEKRSMSDRIWAARKMAMAGCVDGYPFVKKALKSQNIDDRRLAADALACFVPHEGKRVPGGQQETIDPRTVIKGADKDLVEVFEMGIPQAEQRPAKTGDVNADN